MLGRQLTQYLFFRYMQSFLELLEYENQSPEDPQVLDNFLQVLIKVRNKHNDVAPTMVQGVIEYKEKFGFEPFISSNTQYFLDQFNTNHISFHVLINQHTLPFGSDTNPAHLKHIGNIDPTCNVTGLVHEICREMRSSDVNTGSQPRGPLSGRRVPMAVAGAGHRP